MRSHPGINTCVLPSDKLNSNEAFEIKEITKDENF